MNSSISGCEISRYTASDALRNPPCEIASVERSEIPRNGMIPDDFPPYGPTGEFTSRTADQSVPIPPP